MDPDGRASILGRVINDGVNKYYNLAHDLGNSTGWKWLKHSIIDFEELDNFDKVSHYSGISSGVIEIEIPGSRQYEIYYSDMRDDIMKVAVKNVLTTNEFENTDYEILSNDCNDYTNAVYKEYKKLWKQDYKSKNQNSNSITTWFAWLEHRSEIRERRGEIITIGGDDGIEITD